MTYDSKIERAGELVAQHNQVLEADDHVDFEDFLTKLKKSGGTSEERLGSCSFEDLEAMGLPKLLAKDVGRVFRSASTTETKPFVSANKAAGMSVGELLASYDPREADNAVGKRLSEISKGQPTIVFNDDGTVNVAESVTLMGEIREGYEPREIVEVEGRQLPVYRVGERPDQFADENPLYPGRPLRPDGTCDQTNRSWDGVDHTIRVLLRLALTETAELKINSIDDVHDTLDRVMKEGAEQNIRSRYSRASVRFDELKLKGEVPSLKISLTGNRVRQNQPFAVGGHRRY